VSWKVRAREAGDDEPYLTQRHRHARRFVLVVLVINLIARGLDSAVGGASPAARAARPHAMNGADRLPTQLLADYGHPVQRPRGKLGSSVRPGAR
jgi:hypothetical protein